MIIIYQYDHDGYPTGEMLEQDESAAISPGWTHKAPTGVEGERFVGDVWQVVPLPPPPVPRSVTPRQARLALLQAGLLSQVDDALASLEPGEREAAQIEWEYATAVERGSQWIANLGAALGLSETEIDELFVTASGL